MLHKHIAGTGEDLAQGVGFWYAFLTSFWGPRTMVLSKRVGLLPGPGLALSFWFPFFLELWLLYFLLSCFFFFGRYLGCNSVPGQGLDSCVVVWLSFFVAVLVGPFLAVLVVVLLFAFV